MASILDTVLGTGPQRARRSPPAPGDRPPAGGDGRKTKRLVEIESFGADPGSLRMLAYWPKALAPGAALVVVLHGCTQTAESYDVHSGWSALADKFGFAVLYPEQRRDNNPAGCFNWFLPADSARGLGEARSIREMIETLTARRRLDRGRVFVTGLSAGGAMAANLLAAYPETFAAGAIIAGLPCGAATNVGQAFDAMARPTLREGTELGDAVRAGAPSQGLWPRVSIWQGLADRTVAPENADQLVRQWLDVHGAPAEPSSERREGSRVRRVWTLEGRTVVEATTIEGLGHGTPLDARRGERPGPFMLDAGVSSTREIAAFFGLAATPDARAGAERPGTTTNGARKASADAGSAAAGPDAGATRPRRPQADRAAKAAVGSAEAEVPRAAPAATLPKASPWSLTAPPEPSQPARATTPATASPTAVSAPGPSPAPARETPAGARPSAAGQAARITPSSAEDATSAGARTSDDGTGHANSGRTSAKRANGGHAKAGDAGAGRKPDQRSIRAAIEGALRAAGLMR